MNQLRHRRAMLVVAILVAAVAAAPAQASKPKKPKYRATIDATAHMDEFSYCDYAWITDWVFHGTYTPTTLTSAATLDAVTRTASGTIQWTEQQYLGGEDCVNGETGTCSLGVETPIPGAAGYEDATLEKAPGGLRVETIVDNAILILGGGVGCHGSATWGLNREYVDNYVAEAQHGLIPSSKIGKKTITVPLAATLHGADAHNHADGQFTGTLTLVRKGKR
jgi:hypothetical protein